VTGGEALFKVSLKDQKVVLDSFVINSIDFHYEIPFKINCNDMFFVHCPGVNDFYTFIEDSSKNIDTASVKAWLGERSGVIFAVVGDKKVVSDYIIKFVSFSNDTFKASVSRYSDTLNLKDTTSIINRIKTEIDNSWFTFKVYTIVND
jgi:hypothetical protein